MSAGRSNDDDVAATDIRQNLLDEAYSAAAYNVAALQSTLDGMDEALVAEVREAYERSKQAMLGEFAKRIDSEMQLIIKKHRHEQQQLIRGDVCRSANAPPQQQRQTKSARGGSGSQRAPATAWSERKSESLVKGWAPAPRSGAAAHAAAAEAEARALEDRLVDAAEILRERQEKEVARLMRRQQEELQAETERITSQYQQLHSKSAGILLGDSSLAEPMFKSSDLPNSQYDSSFDGDRAGGLIHKQQRAATAAATCRLRRQYSAHWVNEMYDMDFNSKCMLVKRRHRGEGGAETLAWQKLTLQRWKEEKQLRSTGKQLLHDRAAEVASSLRQQTSAAASAAISAATSRMVTRHEAELKAMRGRHQRQQHLQIGLERERLDQLGGKRGPKKEAAAAGVEKPVALWRLQEEKEIGHGDGDKKKEQSREEIRGGGGEQTKEELHKHEHHRTARQRPGTSLADSLSSIAKTDRRLGLIRSRRRWREHIRKAMNELQRHFEGKALAARAVLEKRKNDLKSQKAREMGCMIQDAVAASVTLSLAMKAPERVPHQPAAAATRQLPRGGGAYARKPPPAAPLDETKTKLPFDPLPPPPPPPKEKEPPPPPVRIRMAKEREGATPLAERLEPGDVDFGKLPVEHPLFLSLIRQARDATAERALDLAQQYYAD